MPKIYTAGNHSCFWCKNCGKEIFPGQQYKQIGKNKFHLKPVCEEASSRLSEMPELLDGWWIPDYLKTKEERCLRNYSVNCARESYTCYACDHDWAMQRYDPMGVTIFTGMNYRAEVWLVNGKIEVRRFHDPCPTPPDIDECEEEERYYEELLEEIDDSEEMPIAA